MQANVHPQSAVIIPFPTRKLPLSGRARSAERSLASAAVCSEAFDSWYHQAAIDEDAAKRS